jgi:gas vesicle protein
MGLFDDLLGKASELTGIGQDAADAANQVTENVTSQVDEVTGQAQEQVTNATENLPQDSQDIINHISGDSNEKQ